MKILPELDVGDSLHLSIQELRNSSFPDDQVSRSYFKQLPHYRALKYSNNELIGYMGLDYRVIRVGELTYKILGVVDFCVLEEVRGKGVGTEMLNELEKYSYDKEIDFIILISDNDSFYERNGFQSTESHHSWLRIDDHKSYGVAFEHIKELYVKPVGEKTWENGHVDWLGYMF